MTIGTTQPYQVALPVKKPPVNAGDTGSISGSGRYSGEGNGNPPQYSCLGHPMDRGTPKAIVHGVAKELDMTEHIGTTQEIALPVWACEAHR